MRTKLTGLVMTSLLLGAVGIAEARDQGMKTKGEIVRIDHDGHGCVVRTADGTTRYVTTADLRRNNEFRNLSTGEMVELQALPGPTRRALRVEKVFDSPTVVASGEGPRFSGSSLGRFDPDRGPGHTSQGRVSWVSPSGDVLFMYGTFGPQTYLIDSSTDMVEDAEQVRAGDWVRVNWKDETDPVATHVALVSAPEPVRISEVRYVDREPQRNWDPPSRLPDTGSPLPLLALLGLGSLGAAAGVRLARRRQDG